MKKIHVVPNSAGGWDSKKAGAQRASRHFDTKAKALEFARKQARREKAELFIHKKNGQFQNRDSHGNDPYPPKG